MRACDLVKRHVRRLIESGNHRPLAHTQTRDTACPAIPRTAERSVDGKAGRQSHNQTTRKTNQARRKLRYALRLLHCKPILAGDILSVDPAELAQLLPECVHHDRHTGRRAWVQETDAENFPCLLRVSGNTKRKEHGAKRESRNSLLHFSPHPLYALPS